MRSNSGLLNTHPSSAVDPVETFHVLFPFSRTIVIFWIRGLLRTGESPDSASHCFVWILFGVEGCSFLGVFLELDLVPLLLLLGSGSLSVPGTNSKSCDRLPALWRLVCASLSVSMTAGLFAFLFPDFSGDAKFKLWPVSMFWSTLISDRRTDRLRLPSSPWDFVCGLQNKNYIYHTVKKM